MGVWHGPLLPLPSASVVQSSILNLSLGLQFHFISFQPNSVILTITAA